MTTSQTPTQEALLSSFTDVVYITDGGRIPGHIRHLLKQKKLSYAPVAVDQFPLLRDRLDLVGTVVVHVQDIDSPLQRTLARLIETLEMENIGVILLTGEVQGPNRSFSLASAKGSRSGAHCVGSVSLDDLWVRISTNLAYRTSHSGAAVKPAGPRNLPPRTANGAAGEDASSQSIVQGMTEQLQMAGQVQRDFLPGRLPNSDRVHWAACFLPAEWVSGDIYDVTRIDEHHIGFYLADAVGHAMPAALLTIFIKQALVMRETVDSSYRIFTPAEAMANLNAKMTAQKLSGYQFATCCYCLLNTETLRMTFARAGHPYPALLRSGLDPQPLETQGSLLGVFEGAQFSQQTVQLQTGDKLIVYSDGAESLIGQYQEGRGTRYADGFCSLADKPIAEIVDSLREQAGQRRVSPGELDDITIVGLQIV